MTTFSMRTSQFKKDFEDLPHDIQKHAVDLFNNWKEGGVLPIKNIAQLGENFFSLEINYRYRALGIKQKVAFRGETLTFFQWYFIGTHEKYNKEYKKRVASENRLSMANNAIVNKLKRLTEQLGKSSSAKPTSKIKGKLTHHS